MYSCVRMAGGRIGFQFVYLYVENYCYYDERTISNGLHRVHITATYLQ